MVEHDELSFVPGAIVGGRYRLVAPHGGRPLLQFWEAVDTLSAQEVALTLVDLDGELPEEFVHEILARTVRLKGIDAPGIARVLNVLHTGLFGVVVCEWIPGRGLSQLADTSTSPAVVASAMQSLAAAADAAHRAGLVLSLDHPSRLRVGVDGQVTLAFPATMPDATTRSDLRAIGEALYAMLVNQWHSDDMPAEPAAIDPRIPFLLSATVAALLRDEGGIANAATLLTLLRQAAVDGAEESNCRIMPMLLPPSAGCYAGFRNFGPDEQADAARRLIMRTSVGAAATIVVVAVLVLASTLNGLLGDKDDTAAMDADKLGLNPAPTSAPPPAPDETVRARANPGGEVQPAAVAVFSPDGSPDSPGEAGLVIDNNRGSAWSTDRYYDADPFPKFKSGIGLLVQLPEPTPLSAVTVDLNSAGTVVEVRSAASSTPRMLAETTELAPPTPMKPGQNRIPITNGARVSNVLVWISKLGSADGQNRAAVSEIDVHAASPPA